ncbi:unnamed protein product [Arctia plantaginis]|uniref:Uncharacterized protein n=1 Tax=Arctia plantaginis TaxID=874455 RepID=A0A8S0ZVC9_ARCPL|nr:unnamed protein product [Arctia plantaginis]
MKYSIVLDSLGHEPKNVSVRGRTTAYHLAPDGARWYARATSSCLFAVLSGDFCTKQDRKGPILLGLTLDLGTPR